MKLLRPLKFKLVQRFLISVIYYCPIAFTANLIVGCYTPDPQLIDYHSQTKSKGSSLEIPPNMAKEVANLHQAAAAGKEGITLSSYQQNKAHSRVKHVLPPILGMHIQRDGVKVKHWLVIENRTPEQLEDPIRRFWQQEGFVLIEDLRARGVIETDWKKTHPAINQGFIRNMLSKALGPSSYTNAERNKYRTRIEAGSESSGKSKSTRIFIDHTGMHEVLIGQKKESSRWENSPNHPEFEVEYLQRLMHALAAYNEEQQREEQQRTQQHQQAKINNIDSLDRRQRTMPLSASADLSDQTQTQQRSPNHFTQFNLNEPFDRAWSRVGLALKRSNLTVDSQERARGFYTIRYVDPNDRSVEQQNFWHQIFHGKKERTAKLYRVNVRAMTETLTRIAVVSKAGEIDTSAVAQHILSLLIEQLH